MLKNMNTKLLRNTFGNNFGRKLKDSSKIKTEIANQIFGEENIKNFKQNHKQNNFKDFLEFSDMENDDPSKRNVINHSIKMEDSNTRENMAKLQGKLARVLEEEIEFEKANPVDYQGK